jgi:hypothetical protein
MSLLNRRRLLTVVALVMLPLVAVTFLFVVRGQNLRLRSEQITVGMPREQVEEILGPPVLELPRPAGNDRFGRGVALIWVDQFWQVDVLTDRDGRVESIDYTPSDSLYRRTIGRIVTFPR